MSEHYPVDPVIESSFDVKSEIVFDNEQNLVDSSQRTDDPSAPFARNTESLEHDVIPSRRHPRRLNDEKSRITNDRGVDRRLTRSLRHRTVENNQDSLLETSTVPPAPLSELQMPTHFKYDELKESIENSLVDDDHQELKAEFWPSENRRDEIPSGIEFVESKVINDAEKEYSLHMLQNSETQNDVSTISDIQHMVSAQQATVREHDDVHLARLYDRYEEEEDEEEDDGVDDDDDDVDVSADVNSTSADETKSVEEYSDSEALLSKTALSLDNESICTDCHGGGELICCDGCTSSYHIECVPVRYRPIEDTDDWFCPECMYKNSFDIAFRKRGYLAPDVGCLDVRLNNPIRHGRANPIIITPPITESTLSSSASPLADTLASTPTETSSSILRTPYGGAAFEEGTHSTRGTISFLKTSRSPTANVSIQTARNLMMRSHTESSEPTSRRRHSKRDSEGTSIYHKINIGSVYQVPDIPRNFLDTDEVDIPHHSHRKRHRHEFNSSLKDGFGHPNDLRPSAFLPQLNLLKSNPNTPPCKIVYSYNRWKKYAEKKLNLYVPPDVSSFNDSEYDKPMASDGTAGKEERSNVDVSLKYYLELCEKNWPTCLQWLFSTEYALKLLHCCDYECEKAINCLRDSNVDLREMCDPPVRPYMNKWRPKDRRGFLPSVPFPPVNYRGRALR